MLYEPCGGICAGLEAVLRNGITVSRYIYSDVSLAAQNVARTRVLALSDSYPRQLSRQAVQWAFTTLPMDILQCNTQTLVSAGALQGEQWLVIAGPECKDFSPAGKNRGLAGPHAAVFRACIGLIGALQQLQRVPPLYIIENAALQHNFRSREIRERDFPALCQLIGRPVTLDAARVGSYAHRLRNFWSNLAPFHLVQDQVQAIQRPPHVQADAVLKPGRFSSRVEVPDRPPFYPANTMGQPRSAFPTLVAYPMSRAFKLGRPGAVYDIRQGRWTEPDPDEREAILGYPIGCTVGSPPLPAYDRHVLTGNCIDQAALSVLVRILVRLSYQIVRRPEHQLPVWRPVHRHPQAARPVLPVAPRVLPKDLLGSEVAFLLAVQAGEQQPPPDTAVLDVDPSLPTTDTTPLQVYNHNKRMARAAYEPGALDIVSDAHVLDYLAHGKLPASVTTHRSLRRIIRRARGYRVEDSVGGSRQIYRVLGNGAVRLVPPVVERPGIIETAHRLSGHFGVRRTAHLLLANYWWQGILADVTKVVGQCLVCDQVRAKFSNPTTQLQSLPIEGLFYRWGVDTSGPYRATARGNRYIMHAIEYFSAVLVLEPMPTKEARDTAYAFQHGVLERFGSCAEVLTDNGGEYQGEFQQLLSACFIDHRLTSPNHPQANGLAERSVGTIKRALRTHCQDTLSVDTWDVKLPFVALAYNCSVQQATRCSPYQLVYAREPTFPSSAARDAMRTCLPDMTSNHPNAQAKAVANLLQRAEYVRAVLPTIASNLAIAHHRDSLRYTMRRSGGWLPQLRKFMVGDFVYVRKPNQTNTLQTPVKQTILRVMKVTPSGYVALQGRCGCVVKNHVRNLARCHLPHIDGTIYPELARPSADLMCEKCGYPDDDGVMLLCDICSRGWHTYCLQPPLVKPPAGDWICPHCIAAGIQVVPPELKKKRKGTEERTNLADKLFATKTTRAADLAARAYDGRLVAKTKEGSEAKIWGMVTYRGDIHRPNYFLVRFDDGTEAVMTRRAVSALQPLPKGAQRPTDIVMPVSCVPSCGHPAHLALDD
jgi:transposase InsO family protein